MALSVVTRSANTDVGRRRFGLLLGLLVVTLAALIWAVSYPGVPFGWVALSLLTALGSVVLTVRLLSQHADRIHPVLVVGIVAVTLALGIGVVTSDAPRTVRFDGSRSAFDQLVAGHDPLPASAFPEQSWDGTGEATFGDRPTFPGECPGVVGTYAISECRSIEGGYLFLQQENAVTDDSGIAWLPNGPAPQTPDGSGLGPSGFTHLDGPWYRWSCYC
jgi:hypothetical protein